MHDVRELTANSLDAVVEENDIVLILFGRPGCPSCRAFGEVFTEASEVDPEIAFFRVDTSREKDLARAFEVDAVPTLAVLREQVLLLVHSGVLDAEALKDVIRKAREIDMDDLRRQIEREAEEERDGHPGPAAGTESTAPAIRGDGTIDESFSLAASRGRYVALFFYPLDFTFVCPSEILAFDARHDAFAERECDIIGVSVDSHFTHLAWRKTSPDDGGIGPIRYPLVSDLKKEISRDYGVLTGDGVALRGTFLIDREGIVKHEVVNDLALGRNVDEFLRTLDALHHVERSGEVCPAGWSGGDPAMEPTSEGVSKYLKSYRARL